MTFLSGVDSGSSTSDEASEEGGKWDGAKTTPVRRCIKSLLAPSHGFCRLIPENHVPSVSALSSMRFREAK